MAKPFYLVTFETFEGEEKEVQIEAWSKDQAITKAEDIDEYESLIDCEEYHEDV